MKILFFAALKDHLGQSSLDFSPREGVRMSVKEVVENLCRQDAHMRSAFAAFPLWQVAINKQLAEPSSYVEYGDEVAFFPPFSGG